MLSKKNIELRTGKITATAFADLCEGGTKRQKIIQRIADERMGLPVEQGITSAAMQYGIDNEQRVFNLFSSDLIDTVAFYNGDDHMFVRELWVQKIVPVAIKHDLDATRNKFEFGATPDGWTDDHTGKCPIEIKCPISKENYIKQTKHIPSRYIHQVELQIIAIADTSHKTRNGFLVFGYEDYTHVVEVKVTPKRNKEIIEILTEAERDITSLMEGTAKESEEIKQLREVRRWKMIQANAEDAQKAEIGSIKEKYCAMIAQSKGAIKLLEPIAKDWLATLQPSQRPPGVSFRTIKTVNITDADCIGDDYRKPAEFKINALKQALEDGKAIVGAELVTEQSISIMKEKAEDK